MANKLTINLEKSYYMIFHRFRLKYCGKKDVIIQERRISHVTVGRNEAIYKTFTFHGFSNCNYISTKILVNGSYVSFKHSSELFMKNSPIPYRVT